VCETLFKGSESRPPNRRYTLAVGKEPKLIGLISDTHGLLREQALRALRGSELIVHAGDVGEREILGRLGEIAPVVAVRGNVDTEDWAQVLPETAVAEAGQVHIYVLHDLKALDLDPAAAGFQVVVSGHSHIFGKSQKSGVLYINPGSAGPRRFQLPITVARMTLGKAPWKVEFVDLEKLR
jgi:putative phosphoesterase